MIAFWLIAAAMLLVALAVILPPLLQRPQSATAERGASEETTATVAVYRERLAELAREYERGHMTEADYAAAQAETKRELLQYLPEEPNARARGGATRWATVVTMLAVPAIAVAVYAASGRPDLLGANRADRLSPDQAARYSEMDPQARIQRLEPYLEQHPAAPRAWSLLASAYRSEDRYQAAAEAYGRALRTGDTTDAQLVARQAEALLLANERRFTEDIQALIDASLEAKPRNPLGLMLAGHAALARGDDAAAADHWRRLAEQIPENDRRRQLVDALIARAEEGPAATASAPADAAQQSASSASDADAGPSLRIRLRLTDALREQAPDDATVFVFARRAGAEGGPPLAVSRTRAAALPAETELSDAQAMMADQTLSSADRVVVTARVSRSGDVSPSSGDLQGRSAPIATDRSDPVELVIDQQIE